MTALSQPTLERDGLVLRPFDQSDAPAVVAAYADPGIRRWHVRTMVDAGEVASWISDRADRWQGERGGDWAVLCDGELAGRAGLNAVDLEEGSAELAYWVVPAARGAGVAVRAARLLTDWALGDLGLHRVGLEHSTQNEASCRVATRAGLAAEGVRRSSVLHADGWHDMHVHARIAD